MKVSQILSLMRCGVVAVGILIAGVGCETEQTAQASIDIEPREADLRAGESVTLRASGWHSYQWALEDAAYGYLSARIGDEVTYTSITTNAAVQVITVRGSSGGTGGTNAFDIVSSAIVRHIAEESPVNEQPQPEEPPPQVTINVEPRDAELLPDESVVLRASGWQDYNWSLSDATLGNLSHTTGDVTVYTSMTTNVAIQVITVRGTSGGTVLSDGAASAVIMHMADTN